MTRPRATRICLWLTALWCGAGVMGFELAGARLLTPPYGMGIEVECVEIDPEVVRLAAERFGLGVPVTICDARAFLRQQSPGQFDAVVLDTFVGGTAPEHLYTREAFADAARTVWPGEPSNWWPRGGPPPAGMLVVHLIGRPHHPAVRAVARTLGTVFPHTMTVRSGVGDELQHIYLFASHQPLRVPRSGELAAPGEAKRAKHARTLELKVLRGEQILDLTVRPQR